MNKRLMKLVEVLFFSILLILNLVGLWGIASRKLGQIVSWFSAGTYYVSMFGTEYNTDCTCFLEKTKL